MIYPQKNFTEADYKLAIIIQASAIFTGATLAYILGKTIFQIARFRQESESNNRLLNAVMDTLTLGICAFSTDMTLLKWNNNLETILDLPQGTIKVGILYKVLTKHLDQISYQTSEEMNGTSTRLNVVEASFLKQDINYFERNLQDGRTLEISMTPMPDGGFVVVYSDITQRKKAERVIRHMAHFDSLTGLANRGYFTEKLEGLLNQKRQSDATVTLALIDLDKFKEVNDTYGHPMGDALLQRVSEILKSNIRDDDFLARIGGDEFAILFPNTSDVKEAMVPLNRMLKALTKPIIIRNVKLHIGASIGVSQYPQNASSTESLIKAADDALYVVKENGRGNIEIATKTTRTAKLATV